MGRGGGITRVWKSEERSIRGVNGGMKRELREGG